MLEEAGNGNPKIVCEQVTNDDNEHSIEKEQSASTPVAPNKTKKPPEIPIYAKIGTEKESPKQDCFKGCLMCSRSYANMRHHLTKTHQLSKRNHSFLLSFHRMQICTSIVYQCKTCCVRFTGKKKHKKYCRNCQIIRVRADSKDEFPIDIKEYAPSPSGNISQDHRLLTEFDENRIDAGDQHLTRFQKTS